MVGQLMAFAIPSQCRQLILGVTPGWNDSHVQLQCWEHGNSKWFPVSPTWEGRVGRNGLAWGRGLSPNQKGLQKQEGDGRAPAGVFMLGGLYGYAPSFPCKPGVLYHQITPRDLWVEDPESPYYNSHLHLKTAGPTNDWERKQQMKLNDEAHSLKIFIRHNAGPTRVRGGGSSIFFHIWRRSGDSPSSGCTVMPKEDLEKLARWVDPQMTPLYVLLSQEEYTRLKPLWNLP